MGGPVLCVDIAILLVPQFQSSLVETEFHQGLFDNRLSLVRDGKRKMNWSNQSR